MAPTPLSRRDLDNAVYARHMADLEKLVQFSQTLSSPGRTLRELLMLGVSFLCDMLSYDTAEFYCLYRYAGTIGRAASSDELLPFRDVELLKEIMFEGKIVVEPDAEGSVTISVPIMVHGGEVDQDPSEEDEEEYTWWGVFVVTSREERDQYSLLVLDLLGKQVAQASEIFELRQYERHILGCLGHTQEISMNGLAAMSIAEFFNILAESESVRSLFDGLGMWLSGEDDDFSAGAAFVTDTVRAFDIKAACPDGPFAEPRELYDLQGECHSVILCPLINATRFYGVIGFFKTFKRMFRAEERAAAQVISRQAAYSIESILLRRDLETQDIALKFEKDFSEKIFASINSGIIVIDAEGVVLTANPHAVNDLELQQDEIVGKDIEILIPGILDAASDNQREGFFDLCSGKSACLGFNVSPLNLNDGVAGKIILFRDITEIVHLRKELRRKEYFSTIGRMASWIAHEVRNPVFAISSIATILQKQAKNKEQEVFVGSILKETKTLNLLVDDLLLYGKPLELKPEKLAIGDFLLETAHGMESLASALGGKIAMGRDGDNSACVAIDKDRMKQVLYNVIKNSLEAGADTVTVDVTVVERTLHLCLRDNGKGIKPSHLTEMFTPFFTTKKGGTGLGLPNCKKIVEEHGGTIRISSEPGTGAEVDISLTLV